MLSLGPQPKPDQATCLAAEFMKYSNDSLHYIHTCDIYTTVMVSYKKAEAEERGMLYSPKSKASSMGQCILSVLAYIFIS